VLPPKGDEPVPVFAEAVFVFPKEDLEGSLFCSSDPKEEAEGLNVVDVPNINLGVDVVAAVGVVEVVLTELEAGAGVVGILKLNVEVLLVGFCWSDPNAPVSDEEEAEGRAVVEAAAGGFGVANLLGTLKVNFRGAFVDEDVVADGLGCAEGVWERLPFIELLGLETEKWPKTDCGVGCAGVGLDSSGAGAGA
jgi:hypothetical protein